MSTSRRSNDRFSSTEVAENLNVLMIPDKMERPSTGPSVFDDQEAITVGSLWGSAYPANSYSFGAEAALTGGYENGANTRGAYHPYGIYDEMSSTLSHGKGFSPQNFQRQYAPVTTPTPSVQCHGDWYHDHARHANTPDPSYYRCSVPENIHFASQCEVFRENFPTSRWSGHFGPRTDLAGSSGLFGRRNNLLGNPGDLCSSQEGLEVGALNSNCSKSLHRKSSFFPLTSTAACLKHMDFLELFGNDFEMGSQQNVLYDRFESSSSFSYRDYSRSQINRASCHTGMSGSSLGNSYNWPTLDEARREGMCNDFFCSCSISLDMLSERNKGPRACKPSGQTTVKGFSSGKGKNGTTGSVLAEFYNHHDFPTEYKNAKFFVIKSYSEDNVHKSIKYGVWASTPNGNKKLDAAYHEAKEKGEACPVFLLFSVNASAQFCGVAEMVGPVDFDTSVEYWLQDKWSGHFPVKWHIIKDVPNSLFRHIVLANNDNKPVTNSRDTQEVGLEQGLEMLKIFKTYEAYSSILDDFCFYEERQKAMQERKAKQQASLAASAAHAPNDRPQISTSLPSDFVKKMSKSFAEALALNENLK